SIVHYPPPYHAIADRHIAPQLNADHPPATRLPHPLGEGWGEGRSPAPGQEREADGASDQDAVSPREERGDAGQRREARPARLPAPAPANCRPGSQPGECAERRLGHRLARPPYLREIYGQNGSDQ